jgi:hypothetical protein
VLVLLQADDRELFEVDIRAKLPGAAQREVGIRGVAVTFMAARPSVCTALSRIGSEVTPCWVGAPLDGASRSFNGKATPFLRQPFAGTDGARGKSAPRRAKFL